MAETQTLAEMYGMGGQQYPGPDEIYTTADVNARAHQGNPVSNALRGLAGYIPTNQDHGLSALNMIHGGLNSAANWLERRPEVGPDTLAPLGLAGMGALAARPAVTMARPKEFPTTAAIRWGDQTFTGPNHAHILINTSLRDVPMFAAMQDGFVTNAGRFITREEASSMTGAPRVVRNGMVSEALDTGLDEARRTGRGFASTLTADSSRASLPGTIVNGLEQAAPRIDNPIRAYHGSPHDFDKFSMDKIGTGEGAQAYGHGLYFAEHEGVARGYRDALTKPVFAPSHVGSLDDIVNGVLQRTNRDIPKAIEHLQSRLGEKPFTDAAMNAEHTKLLEKAIDYVGAMSPGRMYEVNLHATPEQFLDWDKPLRQQPQAVREWFDNRKRESAGTSGYVDPRYAKMESGRLPVPEVLRSFLMKDEAVADAFRGSGVHGVKYLDQGSRGAGQGTSNYVVWTPEIIEVLRKYGLVGAAALPPAVQGAFSDHDPLNPWRQ